MCDMYDENTVFMKSSEVKAMRDKITDEQGGKCPLCFRELKSPCLDHDHCGKGGIGTGVTRGNGRVRGVLCSGCNVLLGKVENNALRYSVDPKKELPDFLRRCGDYIESDYPDIIHPSEVNKIKPKRKLSKTSYNKIVKYYRYLYPRRKIIPPYRKNGNKVLFEMEDRTNDLISKIESGEYKILTKRELISIMRVSGLSEPIMMIGDARYVRYLRKTKGRSLVNR